MVNFTPENPPAALGGIIPWCHRTFGLLRRVLSAHDARLRALEDASAAARSADTEGDDDAP